MMSDAGKFLGSGDLGKPPHNPAGRPGRMASRLGLALLLTACLRYLLEIQSVQKIRYFRILRYPCEICEGCSNDPVFVRRLLPSAVFYWIAFIFLCEAFAGGGI
jgi:hypothetical protein